VGNIPNRKSCCTRIFWRSFAGSQFAADRWSAAPPVTRMPCFSLYVPMDHITSGAIRLLGEAIMLRYSKAYRQIQPQMPALPLCRALSENIRRVLLFLLFNVCTAKHPTLNDLLHSYPSPSSRFYSNIFGSHQVEHLQNGSFHSHGRE
jgi:hypothetical protein